MERDKNQTKQKLIDAVGAIVVREGFNGIGVNAVAKEAGCDKVLIYRYFENLDGLIEAFVNQNDYFANIGDGFNGIDKIENADDVKVLAKGLFANQLKEALDNKELQEILLWELLNKNDITIATAEKREKQGKALLDKAAKAGPDDIDIHALSAILMGGIYYLVLRSRNISVFNGIDLTKEKGWERIGKAIDGVIELAVRK